MMACHVIFRPGSVAGIKSKTGPKISSLVRTRVDGCIVARGFRRSVRPVSYTHLTLPTILRV